MGTQVLRRRQVVAVLALLLIGLGAGGILLRPAKADLMPERSVPKSPAFDALRSLAGTWVSVAPAEQGQKPMTLAFKSTSGDTAIIESMFPGSDHEMVNMYTASGKDIFLTHYCAMGNQPRMRLTSFDNGVLKFEFVDGGNLKSRNEPHMDSVEMTIAKDRLIEKWTMYQDGKSTGDTTFEFKRQSEAAPSK